MKTTEQQNETDDIIDIINKDKTRIINILTTIYDLKKSSVNFTYKKNTESAFLYDIYCNGEYFYSISTPVQKVIDMFIPILENAYKLGKLNSLQKILEVI